MTLQSDIISLTRYIDKCQTEGSQPDQDYAEIFSRICKHIWDVEAERDHLQKQWNILIEAAKIIKRELEI